MAKAKSTKKAPHKKSTVKKVVKKTAKASAKKSTVKTAKKAAKKPKSAAKKVKSVRKTASRAAPKKTAKKAAKRPSRKAVKVVKKRTAKRAKKVEEDKRPFDVRSHVLVPNHEVLTEEEVAALFDRFDVQPTNLPTISSLDPALKGLQVKMGDIIRITRPSHTANESVFYRRVSYE